MYVIIEEYIEKLSRNYSIVGIFNTEEEANILCQYKWRTEGEYQERHGYYYNCTVNEVETSFTQNNNEVLYVLIESGIYACGITKEYIRNNNDLIYDNRADFKRVVGVYESEEELRRVYEGMKDEANFYFSFRYKICNEVEEIEMLL